MEDFCNSIAAGILRVSMHVLLTVSRPRFWIYLLGPYVIGAVAAMGQGGSLSWTGLFFALYFTYPANLLIYGVNDVFDADTDALNEKKQGYESRFHDSHYRSLFTVLFILHGIFLPFLFLSSPLAASFLALFLFLGIFYSAPPLRLKARPFLDAASNVLYIMPGLFSYVLFGGDSFVLPIIFAAFLWAMAMHAYSAVPDIAADTRAGIATIATTLGARVTLLMCFVFYVTAGVLTAWFVHPLGWLGVLVYGGLMILSLRAKNHTELFALYRRFPLVNTLMGALLFFIVFFQ